jgi:hypothetical protein
VCSGSPPSPHPYRQSAQRWRRSATGVDRNPGSLVDSVGCASSQRGEAPEDRANGGISARRRRRCQGG